MGEFFDAIHRAINEVGPGETPAIEASRKIVEHFNRGRAIHGFEKAGYFVYQGVKIFEEGKRHGAETRDARTQEDCVFGGKA